MIFKTNDKQLLFGVWHKIASRPWLSSMVVVTVCFLSTLVISGCYDKLEPNDLDHVVFMAGYKPQANLPFVAAYVAKERGYFYDQGLEVDIKHANRGEHLKLLVSGDVDFTTAAATSVLKRRSDLDLPISALVLFGQKSQQGYIALKKSGIETIKDWEGKTFGYKTTVPPDYLAMLEANGVDRSKISEINAGFDPRILTEGKVDILAVFKSNEPDTIRGLGFEMNLWDPSDYGVPSMGLTYITRQDMVDENHDTVKRFIKATLKGLHYVFENKQETLDIVMKYAPDENIEHQRFMLDVELEDAVSESTKTHGLGWMTDEQWKSLYNQLVRFEALSRSFDYKTAYADIFLRELYEMGEMKWP